MEYINFWPFISLTTCKITINTISCYPTLTNRCGQKMRPNYIATRKMRFGVSEGMVLAAGPGGSDIFLLSPDSGAEPGMNVK